MLPANLISLGREFHICGPNDDPIVRKKKDEISPHFLVKFWGNGHISHNFAKEK